MEPGTDGLGSVSVAMQYVLMMFDALGYDMNHPHRSIAREALRKLEVISTEDDEAHLVVSLSPVWDTSLVISALLETGEKRALVAALKGLGWLRPLQIRDFKGDWAHSRPHLEPGGYAFFYNNPHYPDTDDTATVLSVMYSMTQMTSSPIDNQAISVGKNWILGMQSQNGGWGSYDADNTNTDFNNIPFAIKNSLLDPPTVDVTSSIIIFLAQTGLRPDNSDPVRRAVQFVLNNQELNGSWFGRWGVNYIYGTRLALCALVAAGFPLDDSSIIKGASWLISIQNKDGGWGESVESYMEPRSYTAGCSTASQTAWAVLGLLASTKLDHPAIESGIRYLIQTQKSDGLWDETGYTGTGHPGIPYLAYHGYRKYFPLLALARYFKMKSNMEG